MVGNVPVDRKEFISVLQLLHSKGLLDKRTLKPVGKFKDQIDKAVSNRDRGRFRALQIFDAINH